MYKFARNVTILLLIILTASINSYSQFGKNKVQYRTFDWKYIQSKNFDVYYYDSKYLAEVTALYAEAALVKIQDLLNYRIGKRVTIIVYESHNEFQQTNVISQFMPEGIGGVTELMKNRVVIPFEGEYSKFRHVVHHELVHAVLNDMFYGGSLQSAIASGTRVQFPSWMNEGLAEYSSQGGLDTQTDMFMRDVTLSNNLHGLQSLSGYYAYRGGQTFYWYVADKYGKEKVGDLINRLRVYGNLNQAFMSAFDMNLEEFSDQFQKDMKKMYWPDIDKYVDPDEYAERLTDHQKDQSFYNTSPSISPDGEKMAYISAYGGEFGIYISNLKTGKNRDVEKLISSNRSQDFEDLNVLTPGISWSPDGKKLAISAKSGGVDDIYIVDADDGDYDKLNLDLPSISSVVWSPDGNYLSFTATDGYESDLYLYDWKQAKIENITNDIFTDLIPEWSPDSKTLYFVSDRGDHTEADHFKRGNFKIWDYDVNKSDIYSMDIDSREIRRLTFNPQYNKTSLSVTPDGKHLLFVSDENGIGNIYQMDLQNLEYKAKTNSLTGILQLSLSKDGTKLLFSTLYHGGYDIFMIRFPMDKPFIDSLGLTDFREMQVEKKQLLEVAATTATQENQLKKSEPLTGYGDVDIDFSRQQVVHPNPDAIEKDSELSKEESEENVPEDTNFVAKEYKLKFSPDLILGNPGYSTYFGIQGTAQILFSDVLGDHQIYFMANLLWDLRNSNFFLAYNYLPLQTDFSINAYHNSAFFYRSDNFLYRYRNWGVGLLASYPFDRYRRLEMGFQWMNLSRENISIPSDSSVSRMLIVPSMRYVYDDVLYGYFGPVKGTRYYAGLKATPRFYKEGSEFLTIETDIRRYFRFWNYMSVALRFTGAKSIGSRPQNFFLGGTENWINPTFKGSYLPFNEPEDFAFMEFIMPLRGVDLNEREGSQYFLINAEYRFPMFQAVLAGPLPVLFQSIMGAVFLDMGGAWYGNLTDFKSTSINAAGKTVPNDLIMSTGIGLRSYVLGLPLRLDIAWQNLYWNWSMPMYLVSLGYDF